MVGEALYLGHNLLSRCEITEFHYFFSFSLVDEKQISLRFQIDFEFKMQKSNLGRQNEIRMITNEIVSHDVGLWDTIKHNRKYIG
jgi:hypothetical protein